MKSKEPVAVGDRAQVFFDEYWISEWTDLFLERHDPIEAEIAIEKDRPWEGQGFWAPSVVHNGRKYQMWYRAFVDESTGQYHMAYAESDDGIVWKKPSLGLFPFEGSTDNNLISTAPQPHPFGSVFLDTNPECPPDERYKMFGHGGGGVKGFVAFVSADGLTWRGAAENPVLVSIPTDTQNIAYWDDELGKYVAYLRGHELPAPGQPPGSVKQRAGRRPGYYRGIRRAESSDFVTWLEPDLLHIRDTFDPVDPETHFYTNAAVKYPFAERAYLMFPKVFYAQRQFPGAPNPGLSDVQLMTSRNGIHWERRFRRPFVRAGMDLENWTDRAVGVGQGILATGANEISIYHSEHYRTDRPRIRRAKLRKDGFISISASYEKVGEFLTRPMTFTGRHLNLNCRTSAGGTILVEIADEVGKSVPGFSLQECHPIFGDTVEYRVAWQGGDNIAQLAQKPIRLRVQMRDADLFSFQFTKQTTT